MTTNHATSKTFSAITPVQMDVIRELIGAPIKEDQSVFIMTYTPGKEPLATDKKQGSEDLLALLAKAHENIRGSDVADTDVLKDLDEAIRASDN